LHFTRRGWGVFDHSMNDKAGRYRTFAEEARLYAMSSRSPKDRDSLLKLAAEYERMAREVEAVEATKEILQQAKPLLSTY
jgi:hypothetical protein